jgi:CDP-Glycerol:Poly(glycerophosphate) glycerophosphotransferase
MLARIGAGMSAIAIIEMRLPSAFAYIPKLLPKWRDLKVVRLLQWNRALRKSDALVTAERTSTILCKLPGPKPVMIHVPHGAGDRAQGFEKRIARFDYVIAAGEKDRQRMISMNLVEPDKCFVSGYIKYSALSRLNAGRRDLFSTDRPVILYNAHFDQTLSSWAAFARDIIDLIKQDGRYNLIVAPHVRLFETASAAEKAYWTGLAAEDQVIVDLGSERSVDMTYTRAADIYLGDVSSQIYEFVARPRPCVFINSHKAQWQGNPDYRMWQMGDVIDGIDMLLPAVERCCGRHAQFRQLQAEFTQAALGDVNVDAAAIAADIIKQRCLPPIDRSAA